MTQSADSPSSSPSPDNGRYRFRRGKAVDPQEDLHPEMVEQGVEVAANTPDTINELIAMQVKENPDRPEKPARLFTTDHRVLVEITPGIAKYELFHLELPGISRTGGKHRRKGH